VLPADSGISRLLALALKVVSSPMVLVDPPRVTADISWRRACWRRPILPHVRDLPWPSDSWPGPVGGSTPNPTHLQADLLATGGLNHPCGGRGALVEITARTTGSPRCRLLWPGDQVEITHRNLNDDTVAALAPPVTTGFGDSVHPEATGGSTIASPLRPFRGLDGGASQRLNRRIADFVLASVLLPFHSLTLPYAVTPRG